MFGRKWLIEKALQFVANGKLARMIATKVDIPGVPEHVELAMAKSITDEAVSLVMKAINGESITMTHSKRYVAKKALKFVAANAGEFLKEVNVPGVSEETETAFGEMLVISIETDILPLVERVL